MGSTSRRNLLRVGAAGAVVSASALAPGLGGSANADAGPQAWEFVPPGASVQAALDRGATAVHLGAGTYPVKAPIVVPRAATIRGVGQATRIAAVKDMPSVVAIGNGGPVDGVNVSDLVVDANGKAAGGIDVNIVGTTGNYQGEPDAVTRLDGLWIYSPLRDGVTYRGSDAQATITSRVRVRQAGGIGFNVLAPDNVFLACEATTASGGQHGFFVGSANCHFHACKAWYCRGYGWHIMGTRNSFVGCEAQDTKLHGWFIEYDKNTFTGCIADTAGAAAVGGVPGSSDGFYVATDRLTTISSCLAFDRRPDRAAAQQRYGFNLPKTLQDSGLFVANTGWDNTSGTTYLR